jgi:hypothetical protein
MWLLMMMTNTYHSRQHNCAITLMQAYKKEDLMINLRGSYCQEIKTANRAYRSAALCVVPRAMSRTVKICEQMAAIDGVQPSPLSASPDGLSAWGHCSIITQV